MKVTETSSTKGERMVYIGDFSPTRAANDKPLNDAQRLDVDFICVAYSPGKAVRVDSAMLAYAIKRHSGKDVIFNLSTRDMNKLALQTHLLGAQMLGLDNLIVVKGDSFSEKELALVKGVNDFKPTEFMQSIVEMNRGQDYKGRKLEAATNFCIGATIDLGREIEKEAKLTHHKVLAGADYFITQPIFDTEIIATFLTTYQDITGTELTQPVFFGLQVMQKGGVLFSNVPEPIKQELNRGRKGTDISIELLQHLREFGIRKIYIVPPIMRGGARDYEAAQMVLEKGGR